MKKHLYSLKFAAIMILVGFAALTTSCSKDEDDDSDDSNSGNGDVTLMKKYDIEKGMFIIKSWSTLLADDYTYDTVYFKEYGAIEANYSTNDDDRELDLVNGDGFRYSIDLVEKTGVKSASTYARGTETSLKYEDYKDDPKTTKLADTTIIGKTCTYYSYKVSETITSKNGLYKGIQMYYSVTTTNTMGFAFTVYNECIKLEENIDIPASKFNVPAGITFTTFKK